MIVSIGDSFYEYNAAKNAAGSQDITLHRMKLREKPSIHQLNEEIQLIVALAPILLKTKRNICIDYVKEQQKFMKNAH